MSGIFPDDMTPEQYVKKVLADLKVKMEARGMKMPNDLTDKDERLKSFQMLAQIQREELEEILFSATPKVRKQMLALMNPRVRERLG